MIGGADCAPARLLARTRLNVTDARCEALFASGLQRSDTPDADMVAEVISHAVRQLGTRGCAGRMVQEFGDHPEMAADRMRWVRQLVGEVSAPGHRVARARPASRDQVAERTRTRPAWTLHPRWAGSMTVWRPAEVQAGCGAAKGAERD